MSQLEIALAFQIKALGLPPPIPQYPFAAPERRWKADFCWPEQRLIVEVQGGGFVGGRHGRGKGMEQDAEKLSHAALLGYRILVVTGKHVESGEAVSWIKQALEGVALVESAEA